MTAIAENYKPYILVRRQTTGVDGLYKELESLSTELRAMDARGEEPLSAANLTHAACAVVAHETPRLNRPGGSGDSGG